MILASWILASWIRTAWVGFVLLVVSIWQSSQAVWGGISGSNRKRPERCDRIARKWARAIIWASGSKVRVEGLERLPKDRAQILVSNHQSWFDVFALAAYLPVKFRFVAKQELGAIPLFGLAWKSCGHISVDRSDRSAAISSLEKARQRIRGENLTVVMFPEGTRSMDGSLLPFKRGAFVLALQVEVPVVPVAVCGTGEVMPKGRWRVRPGEILIKVGDPIDSEKFSFKDRAHLTNVAQEVIGELKAAGDATLAGRLPADSPADLTPG